MSQFLQEKKFGNTCMASPRRYIYIMTRKCFNFVQQSCQSFRKKSKGWTPTPLPRLGPSLIALLPMTYICR
jgi:hypothetical protein